MGCSPRNFLCVKEAVENFKYASDSEQVFLNSGLFTGNLDFDS
jgi:hypothetical protein